MTRCTGLNILLNLQGNDLIEKPIKELRKEIRINCELNGIANVKELTQLLSKERRRLNKTIYSSQERRRNDCKSKRNETDIESLQNLVITLRKEKAMLLEEINVYENEMENPPDFTDSFFLMRDFFPQETLSILDSVQ